MIDIIVYLAILGSSLAVLAIASQFTIKNVEQIMVLTGLSEASAGFVILSVMTSLPEIFVTIFSFLHGKPGFSLGNILGSNVFNIGFVAGLLAVRGFLRTCCSDLLTELVDILFLSSIIPLVLLVFGKASFFVGLALLGIFVFSIREMVKGGRAPPVINGETLKAQRADRRVILLKLFIGVSIVIASSEFIITSASAISESAGIAPILIGAKIIAIGTSVPELALDLAAAKRGRVILALGDLIGSNLTNITLVLGIVLLMSPPFEIVELSLFAEIVPFVLITTLILWRYLTKGGVTQLGGIALILTYVIFQAIVTV
ncbi:sodium:calcium antiporter [Candidatus Bathyarchaeota archaeon]|nr:sodium:calcium antiporter [Candidatus Bathyarchaeota archaeon]